ncbi:MAG TPA: hypothetical protein VM580_21730 [Labilithrix sp.]|jgi:hypothetical protein|nr:hypothetical protein [Labilithrix sp.]
MKIAPVLAASLFLGIAACASNTTSTDIDGTTEEDRGLEGEGVGAASAAPDTNPDGIPYPTDNIGVVPRKGKKPGNRIANFKFLGYPNANKEGGLQPISLAQFFDPSGTRYKIIHIQASGVWCSACQAETRVVVPMKAELEEKGAVWLVSLAEGRTPGVPSKQSDLDKWISNFNSPFTHWLDPGNKNLGPFYDRTALPWNANIDATTMEILTSGTGGVTRREGIIAEIDDALRLASESTLRTQQ